MMVVSDFFQDYAAQQRHWASSLYFQNSPITEESHDPSWNILYLLEVFLLHIYWFFMDQKGQQSSLQFLRGGI